MVTEMVFFRRSCRRYRIEAEKNENFRRGVIYCLQRQYHWFEHTKRMNGERWLRKILEWISQKRRKIKRRRQRNHENKEH